MDAVPFLNISSHNFYMVGAASRLLKKGTASPQVHRMAKDVFAGKRMITREEFASAIISDVARGVANKDSRAISKLRSILAGKRGGQEGLKRSGHYYPKERRRELIEEMFKNPVLAGVASLYLKREQEGNSHDPAFRHKVFEGVARSLIENNHKIGTSRLSGAEAKFVESLSSEEYRFSAPGEGNSPGREDSFPFQVPRWKMDGSIRFLSRAKDKVAAFVDEVTGRGGVFSDELFEVFHQIALNYARMEPGHCEHGLAPEFDAHYNQLYSLISEPRILMDQRFEKVLDVVAGMGEEHPISFNMFVKYDIDAERDGAYLLDSRVTMEFVGAAERFASKPEYYRGEFGRVFMSSIAEAIKHIAIKNPSETLGARIKMLEMAELRGNNNSCLLFCLVYSFQSAEDRAVLKKMRNGDKPTNRFAREQATLILRGEYDNTLWAI
jgi:hypothetical protein